MVNKNNSAYRRGVLLGLTMAEIIMLVVFILLFAFATLLDREKKHTLIYQKLDKSSNKALDRIVQVISTQPPDMQEDIVRAVEKMPRVISLIKDKEVTQDVKEPVDSVIERGIETLKVQNQLQKETGNKPIEQKLEEALQSNADLQHQLTDATNQKSNLMEQMKAGFDWPPCWPDSSGKPSEYIFNIDLTDNGIVVSDSTPTHRIADKAKLPIASVVYGKVQSIGQFTAETVALFEWSRAHQCHFYVALNDKTGNDKTVYKREKAAVEGHFYKMERTAVFSTKPITKTNVSDDSPDPNAVETPPTSPKKEKSFLDNIF